MLLTNDVAEVRQCAAGALGFIGEDARAAAPALVIAARDWDPQVRNSSLFAMSHIHADLNLCLPALIAGLSESNHVARENATFALVHYGPLAVSAIPALSNTIRINPMAMWAISQINATNASEKQ